MSNNLLVRVCAFSKYSDDLIVELEKNKIPYSNEECLRRCDLCMKVPFVRIEHEFIHKDTIPELIEVILSKLNSD